eukprot:GHVL01006301.1.p1 GENE.GHVL01006301.1~~GHVL01006301.1.p1  ORF type:complete len:261 (+),score=36.03 GHVL01006301.1:762-1544(+)
MLYIIELQKVFDAHATHKIQTILTSQSTKYTIFGYPSNESIETALADFDIFSLNCDITYTFPSSIKRILKFDKEKHKHTLRKNMSSFKIFSRVPYILILIIVAIFGMIMGSVIDDIHSIMKTELYSTRSEIEDTKIELYSTRSEIKDMKTRIYSSRSEIENMKTELYSTRSEIKDMKTRIYSSRSEIEDMKTEINSTRSEIEDMKTVIYSSRSEIKYKKTEIYSGRSEIEDMKSDLQSMNWRLKKMENWTPWCLIGMCNA